MPSAQALTAAAGIMSVVALLGGCSAVTTHSADQFTQNGHIIAMSGGDAGAGSACFTCHGLDGRGDAGGTPRLAGLDVGYLDRQLIAYADGRRRHPMMNWIAGRLSAQDRKAVAAYYAQIPHSAPPGMEGAGQLALYHAGNPARGLPSCASCHGHRGEGMGPANPPLGGQPAPYLADQLQQWKHATRRNDPGDVMLRISRQLTPQEILALSAYAARLPGDQPRPAPPEAFRATHHGGPKNGA